MPTDFCEIKSVLQNIEKAKTAVPVTKNIFLKFFGDGRDNLIFFIVYFTCEKSMLNLSRRHYDLAKVDPQILSTINPPLAVALKLKIPIGTIPCEFLRRTKLQASKIENN